MLQFQTINSGGVGIFYIEIIKVVVHLVDNSDPERFGVTKWADVDPIDVKVLNNRNITVGLKIGINQLQAIMDIGHLSLGIKNGLP